jgi:ATP-binding cassette subfamily C protein
VALAWGGERATQGGLRVANTRQSEIGRLQDFSLQAAEVARALGMRSAVVARQLAERAELVGLHGAVSLRSANFLAATKFFRLLLQSVALAVGAWLAIDQKISAGAIFAAALILGRALQPIEQILAALKNVLTARSAYQNLRSFGEVAAFDPDRTQLPSPKGLLSAEGITVLDPSGNRRILDNVSFCAEPGELIALVGPSGAGKSTLLRALAGAIEVNAGEVRIDGALHSDWDSDRLGRYVGYMPQEPTLFPATIHANICRLASFLEHDRTQMDQQVVKAAMLAGAHDTILRMARAYDTDLGGRDGGLSAGQRQVIALARALYDDPNLILLDEPNAHLDGEGEARLVQAFAELKKRKATIVVSTHRTGILAVADKILVLRDGAVQAFGPRDAIVRGAGAPTSIAASQPRQEAITPSSRAAA